MSNEPPDVFAESRQLKLWVELKLCAQMLRPVPRDARLSDLLHHATRDEIEDAFARLESEGLLKRRTAEGGGRSVCVREGGSWSVWTPSRHVARPVPVAAE